MRISDAALSFVDRFQSHQSWDFLLGNLRQLGAGGTLLKEVDQLIRRRMGVMIDLDIPEIDVETGILRWRGKCLNMGDRPTMVNLFRLFIEAHPHPVKKERLIEALYGRELHSSCSERLRISMQHNAIKMISRARALAEKYWQDQGSRDFAWFRYDRDEDCWFAVSRRL